MVLYIAARVNGEKSMADASEPKSKGRPKDHEKRHSILQAARALFLEHGLAVVSMNAIAESAGVSKVTVYSHFADKDTLFRAVLDAETRDYSPPPGAVHITDCEDLRRQLSAFGTSLMAVLTRPGVLDLGRLLVNEAHRRPEQAARFYDHGPKATHIRLKAWLDAATRQGLLRCDDTDLAADQLLSMWIGQRHLRQQLGLCPPPKPTEIARHVDACVNLILKAFSP